jgi:hypothetical protein
MRLRARDHDTSSTLVGGKAKPVQVRFTLRLRDQRSMYVNARWMYNLHGFLHSIKWNMFHGHLDYSQKACLEYRPNTKLGNHGTPNTHNRWFSLFYHMWGPVWIEFIGRAFRWGPSHIWLHTTLEGPWPHCMMLEVVLGRPLDTFFWALTIS